MENEKPKRPDRTDRDKNFQDHVNLLFKCFSLPCSSLLSSKAVTRNLEKPVNNMHFSCQNFFLVTEFQEISNDLKNRANSADPRAKAPGLMSETVRCRKMTSWIRNFPVFQEISASISAQILFLVLIIIKKIIAALRKVQA